MIAHRRFVRSRRIIIQKRKTEMLRYRAILLDPGETTSERPVQIFGNSRAEVIDWANNVLKHAISPAAVVNIYETIEQQCQIVVKPREEKPKA